MGAHWTQYVQLSEVFYILTTTFLKVSLGLFFLRVLTQPWQRNLFHTILAISAVYGAFYFLVTIFQCGNPAKLADSLLGARNCAPSWFLLTTGYFYGIINVISDWTFTLIPIVILLDSDIDLRSKISVSIVMGFAAIGSIASIMRMVYLKALLFNVSVTRTYIPSFYLSCIESGRSECDQSHPLGNRGAWYRHHRGIRGHPPSTLPTNSLRRARQSLSLRILEDGSYSPLRRGECNWSYICPAIKERGRPKVKVIVFG